MTTQLARTEVAATTAGKAATRPRYSPFERSRRRLFVPFVYPALVVYALIMLAPTVFTIWVSLNHWSGAGALEWAGLDNYTSMLTDPVFGTAFVNTLWIVLGVGVAVFAVAFTLTMLMHDMLGRRFVRAVVFFPSLVPGIVVSILWGYLFNPDGLVNRLLSVVGVHNHPAWLAENNMFKTLLVGMVWLGSGTYTVIFMAAVDRIPPEVYEAAELEGATPWQRFFHITLPMTWDVVSVCAILWCIGALKTFEFILTFSAAAGSLPPKNVWNFAMYSYAEAFNPDGLADYGVASASGVVVLILTGLLTFLARRVVRKDTVTY
ncbi:sugar ABC transporter permease [Dactylosporangium salmoneum]|uniref:Sugar ABC transporter permease n=1 Tax=Dactylosporangium salmoneum TaxID=53361 RepID=A0ABP5UVG7_9ACTN